MGIICLCATQKALNTHGMIMAKAWNASEIAATAGRRRNNKKNSVLKVLKVTRSHMTFRSVISVEFMIACSGSPSPAIQYVKCLCYSYIPEMCVCMCVCVVCAQRLRFRLHIFFSFFIPLGEWTECSQFFIIWPICSCYLISTKIDRMNLANEPILHFLYSTALSSPHTHTHSFAIVTYEYSWYKRGDRANQWLITIE